jgi:hypothetical protein
MKKFRLIFEVTEKYEYFCEAENFNEIYKMLPEKEDSVYEEMQPILFTHNVTFIDAEEVSENKTL